MIEFNGTQTTGAGVFCDKSQGIPVIATLKTAGDGYWSSEARAVKLTGVSLVWVDEDSLNYGELRVFFDTGTWNTQEHGLIYTDTGFMAELQAFLKAHGLAGDDVSYSEQGMQGDDYVSCDVGKEFIDSWVAKFGADSIAHLLD